MSAISILEIAAKKSAGRLRAPDEIVAVEAMGFLPLPVTFGDAWGVSALPRIHADPMDRLLVSQAMRHDLTIVTTDDAIEQYDVGTIRA